jgi:hypothetical protein
MLDRHVHAAFALEGDLSGEHLVEDDAERVEIRLPSDLVTECLFG